MKGPFVEARISCRPIVIGFVALLSAGLSSTTSGAQQLPATPPAPPGDIVRGRQLYDSVGCSQCHGLVGQGASTGPRLAPDPLRYPGFTFLVRNPANQMPPYSQRLLSDAQLADIWAFLSHVPKPRPADQIPLLRPFQEQAESRAKVPERRIHDVR